MQQATQSGHVSFLGALARHKVLCLVVPIVVAAVAAGGAFLIPKTYEAKAVISLVNIDLGANQINMRLPPPKDLAAFFRTGAMIDSLHEKFKGRLPANSHKNALYSAFSVNSAKDSSTIEIRTVFNDAELAAEVATFIAETGTKDYLERFRGTYSLMIQDLQRQGADTLVEADKAESAYRDFVTASNVDSFRRRVESLRSLRNEQETRKAKLAVELAKVQGEIQTWEQAASSQPPLVQIKRSLAANAELQQATAKATSRPVEDLLGLTLMDSVVNPLYVQIQSALANARSLEQSLVAEKKALEDVTKKAEEELSDCQQRLTEAESRLRELDFRREQAKVAARTAANRLNERLTVGMWPPQNVTIVPAYPPVGPAWPNKKLITASAFIAAFVLMWLVAAVIEGHRREVASRSAERELQSVEA